MINQLNFFNYTLILFLSILFELNLYSQQSQQFDNINVITSYTGVSIHKSNSKFGEEHNLYNEIVVLYERELDQCFFVNTGVSFLNQIRGDESLFSFRLGWDFYLNIQRKGFFLGLTFQYGTNNFVNDDLIHDCGFKIFYSKKNYREVYWAGTI